MLFRSFMWQPANRSALPYFLALLAVARAFGTAHLPLTGPRSLHDARSEEPRAEELMSEASGSPLFGQASIHPCVTRSVRLTKTLFNSERGTPELRAVRAVAFSSPARSADGAGGVWDGPHGGIVEDWMQSEAGWPRIVLLHPRPPGEEGANARDSFRRTGRVSYPHIRSSPHVDPKPFFASSRPQVWPSFCAISSFRALLSTFPTFVRGMSSMNSTLSGSWSTDAPCPRRWEMRASNVRLAPSFSAT